jgi:signal peptidase
LNESISRDREDEMAEAAVVQRPQGFSWRKAARVATSAVAGIVFGLLLATGILLVVITQFLDFHLVTIASGSMEPRLEKGDIVLTRPISLKDIDEGDIIYFNDVETGAPFVHRVLVIHETRTILRDGETKEVISERSQYGFVTKGDANANPDNGEVTNDEYRGRVWLTIPTFGAASTGLPLPAILLFAAGLFGFIWLGTEYLARRKPGSRRVRRVRRRVAAGAAAPPAEGPEGPA